MFNIKQKIKFALKRNVLILMYHRIAHPDVDPWELAVSEKNFEAHLQWLQKKNIVQPLEQVIKKLEQNKLNRKSIAITFDDGYADNYHTARPLLEKYGIPATFFISSKNIDTNNEFWWDELANIILETENLPQTLSLQIRGEMFYYELGEETSLTTALKEKHKNYISYQPETIRARLYYKLWEFFSPVSHQEQQDLLDKIRSWANTPSSQRSAYRCLTTTQLKEIGASKLFTIGGHTVNHPALCYFTKAEQREEVLQNKIFLEDISGAKIDLFAYPSGKYNKATVEVINESGFKAAFTTNGKTVKGYAEPFTMGRFQVTNCTAEELKKRLLKWSDQ